MMESQEQKTEVKIYTIHSQKGGVGKTSVALAKAGWVALKEDKRTLIIDGDITGTSLVDIFIKGKNSVRYFNELLLSDPLVFRQYEKEPKRVETDFCMPVDNHKKIFFMPSSSIFEDLKIIVALISQEERLHFFRSRMRDILELLVQNNFEMLIIDTPPGLYGMSQAMREIKFNEIRKYKFKKQSIFVTSPDKPDYRALFSTLSQIYLTIREEAREEWLKMNSIIFNKFSSAGAEPAFKLTEILSDLKSLQEKRKVEEKILDKIKDTASLAAEFDIEQILETVNHLINSPDSREHPTPFQKWCLEIEKI